MFNLGLGTYRTMVFAIGLFLLFDLSVLGLNFLISSEIRDDALNVNIVGRQRMLSQRMAKASLQIRDRLRAEQPYRELLLELDRSAGVFDQTLQAYINGGVISGAGAAEIRVSAVTDEQAKTLLTDTLERQLNDLGLMALCQCYGVPLAAFHSNPSLHQAKHFDSKSATANARISASSSTGLAR